MKGAVMTKEWMDAQEVADYLELDRATVYRMAKDGRLTPYESKARRRGTDFRRDEVEALRGRAPSRDSGHQSPYTAMANKLLAVLRIEPADLQLVIRWGEGADIQEVDLSAVRELDEQELYLIAAMLHAVMRPVKRWEGR
jgi:excisionase family DNA binding protein